MRLQLFFLAVLAFVFTPSLSAQSNMVAEVDKPMSFGTRPGFSISFPNTDDNLVEDTWSDFVKNNFASKLKRGKKGEKTATSCRSASVSAGEFTLYSEIDKVGDGVQLNVWFDNGPYFLNRTDDLSRTNDTKVLLTRFYFDVRRGAIGQEVKAEENTLKDFEKKQERLQRDNSSLNRDIESYKEKLKKAEDDLIQNQKDQEAMLLDIQKQRQAVEAVRQRQGNVENEQRN